MRGGRAPTTLVGEKIKLFFLSSSPIPVLKSFAPGNPDAQRQLFQVGKPFRQSLMGETPKTALPHPNTGSTFRFMGGVISYFRPQTSDLRPQTSDLRPHTSDFISHTSYLRLQPSDFIPQTSDFRLQTSAFRLQTSDFRLQTSDFSLELTLYPY